MGRAVFPSCCLPCDQAMVGVMKIMAMQPLSKVLEFSAPGPAASHCRPTLPPETPEHSQASLGQSLVGTCSFLPGPGAHEVLFVPSKSLFPQSCGSSVIKSTCFQNQLPWGFSVPFPDPPVGKSVVVPRTFLTV